MAMSFLTPKVLQAEVTAGIDIESKVYLTGDRITIGSGAGDDLRLGSADIASEHLTLAYDANNKAWEYFASDRGQTVVDKGNPRTGRVRAGMWFQLGHDTRIDIRAVPRPPEMAETADASGGEKSEVPLAVALPIMGLLVLGALFVVFGLGGGDAGGSSMRTSAWYEGTASLEPALEECVATGVAQAAENGAIRVEPTAPDALFRAHVAQMVADPSNAGETRAALVGKIRETLALAHILATDGRRMEASQTLRRLENVLPVGLGDCPILSAARYDLAIWEIQN